AGTVDITVATAGGVSATSSSDQFTFVATPTVSELDPNNGPIDGGTLVTIKGTNFVDVNAVYFGETAAGFTLNDDGSITAVSPAAEATDTVHVVVTNIGGTSAKSAADKFTYTPSVPTSSCGDGTVDPSEQCDDGTNNGQPGDCCTITCTYQPEGTGCTDDGSLCTTDVCDAAGSCTHPAVPSFTCIPPDVARGASLVMRALPSGGSKTQFNWSQGPAVSLGDFGDPTSGEIVQLCIYEQTAPDSYDLALAGSPSASGGGVWTQRPHGWKFRSRSGAPDGITSVVLKASANPLKAQVQVKAVNSPTFSLTPLQPGQSMIAQLVTSSGGCWGATFSTPTVNSAVKLKAKSD
ncbi:MAG TPA: IPT/TIG domain-containing protein, partial [Candidatus Acidoferrales bacterium]|nr:IPT/TIG domain-containing protein [Candidatus Acidoferrales bacterium]